MSKVEKPYFKIDPYFHKPLKQILLDILLEQEAELDRPIMWGSAVYDLNEKYISELLKDEAHNKCPSYVTEIIDFIVLTCSEKMILRHTGEWRFEHQFMRNKKELEQLQEDAKEGYRKFKHLLHQDKEIFDLLIGCNQEGCDEKTELANRRRNLEVFNDGIRRLAGLTEEENTTVDLVDDCGNVYGTAEIKADATDPQHYNRLDPQPKDVIRSWELNFNKGSAVKYISRAGHKDGADEIEDLKKAVKFLTFEIEALEEGRNQE